MKIAKSFLVSLFIAAPVSVFPLLDHSARLDLIDYYEAGMPAKVENRYGGTTELLHLSDTLIVLNLTSASTMEMRMAEDSAVTLKRIFKTPEGEYCTQENYNYSQISNKH